MKAVLRTAWKKLPLSVRASSPVISVRQFGQWRAEKAHLAASHVLPPGEPPAAPAPAPVVDKRRVVRTLPELDVELKNLDRLATISDDALREGFLEFRMDLADSMPADPWSPEYRAKVFELYEFLHGAPYDPSNEVNVFDIEMHLRAPFPYSTGSAATVGSHLIGIGHLIRTMDLAPKSRVLELGPGWGNTTLALAQMGHSVTAIDIEDHFVRLIAERAHRVGASIDARQGDFALIKELEPGYDAVLFFECFHHAADHLDVLASLDRVVKPGGRVIFAAEPIIDEFPYPWGLRLEGEALRAIRDHGWLELGFQTSYFEQALARNGWSMRHVNTLESQWGSVIVAERLSERPT